jgi:hypothetical protein
MVMDESVCHNKEDGIMRQRKTLSYSEAQNLNQIRLVVDLGRVFTEKQVSYCY